MRISVTTDEKGQIVGTAFHPLDIELDEEEGLIAEPGQEVHVIDLPDELQRIGDVAELHTALENHLRRSAS